MGAHAILFSVNAWISRRAGRNVQARAPSSAVAETPSTFPAEAYQLALDRLVSIAVETGRREERARLDAIMSMPLAERFMKLAWRMARSDVVSPEQATQAFAAAEFDAHVLAQPIEAEGRTLH
jgi:hypothetical protein